MKDEVGQVDPEGDDAQEDAPPEEPDWHDQYLRLVAEFDNFRKRSAREFGELVRSAERDLIGELTEVLDNLDRAINPDHKGQSLGEFTKGIVLIREQFWGVLDKRGLKRVETKAKPFDPEVHDALMGAPSDEFDEGIVIQEVSPGYRLGDRVLKHAKVIVSQGESSSDEPDDSK